MNQTLSEQGVWLDSSIVGGGTFTSTSTTSILIAVWVVLLTIGVAALHSLLAAQRGLLPPGPRGWPILGCLEVFQLGTMPHVYTQILAKKYGPIFLMKLGMRRILVVSSPEMAMEVLKTHDKVMSGRPKKPAAYHAAWDRPEFLWAPSGRYWSNARKFCSSELLSPLRLQKPDFQNIRKVEIEFLLQTLRDKSQQNEDKPINMTQYIEFLVSNIIWRMVMGRRPYNFDGSTAFGKEENVEEILHELLTILVTPNVSDFVPFLAPLDLAGTQKRGKILNPKLDKYFQSVIDEFSLSRSQQSSPTAGLIESQDSKEDSKGNFVEELLKIRSAALKLNGSELPEDACLSVSSIKALTMNMVSGASATPASTLDWALAECMRNPHIMAKAQAELDTVVGRNRLVTEADIPHLKYVQAIIRETLRFHKSPALLGPHESTEECHIAGYRIPANTQIFVNVYSIHRDPSVWERPLEFDPERFLNVTIDMFGSRFDYIPFGSGKRMCPAYNLSLIVMHHTLAQLLHAFTWEPLKGQKLEDVNVTPAPGFLHVKSAPLYALPKPRLDQNVYESLVTMAT